MEIIMCTAVTYRTKSFYFGRTLDYEFSYGEEIAVTPRNYAFRFREAEDMSSHYALIGMAHMENGYPLYYDAVNEKGLAMAGLNFVGNAFYNDKAKGKDNIAQFEFIPWILGSCADIFEAKSKLERINLRDIRFKDDMPVALLHWIIADKNGSLVVESVREGLKIYDNPVGVLTNNPAFDAQMFNLSSYMNLSAKGAENRFAPGLELNEYSRGMGAVGLPGDLSSPSRFVRAAFVKLNSVSGSGEEESVNQFFHIMGSIEQPRGCCDVGGEKYEITIYTSCCNADKGVYYYKTYENHSITAVDMHAENLDGKEVSCYPPARSERITMQNRQI